MIITELQALAGTRPHLRQPGQLRGICMAHEKELRKSPEGLIEEYLPSKDSTKDSSAQKMTYASLVEAALSSLETRAKEVLNEHGLSTEPIETIIEKNLKTGGIREACLGYSARAEQRNVLDRAYFALMIMHHAQQVRSFLDYGATAAAWAMWELSQAAFSANLLVEEKRLRVGRSVLEGGSKGGISRNGTEIERAARWQQIREDFDHAMKSGARSKGEAKEWVAEKHGVTIRTVSRALNRI